MGIITKNNKLVFLNDSLVFGDSSCFCCGDSEVLPCDWNILDSCNNYTVVFSPVTSYITVAELASNQWDYVIPGATGPIGRGHLDDGLWELVEEETTSPSGYSPNITIPPDTDAVHCISLDLRTQNRIDLSVNFFAGTVYIRDYFGIPTGSPWPATFAEDYFYGADIEHPLIGASFELQGRSTTTTTSNNIFATIVLFPGMGFGNPPFNGFPRLTSLAPITTSNLFPTAIRNINVQGFVEFGPVIETFVNVDNSCVEIRQVDSSVTMNGITISDSQIVAITESDAQNLLDRHVTSGIYANSSLGGQVIPPQVKARMTNLNIISS